MLAARRISIIGGGIAGLTLARALQHSGIPSTIYEQSKPPLPTHVSSASSGAGPPTSNPERKSDRHAYGITISLATTSRLAHLLDVTEAQLRCLTAVDGKGVIHPISLDKEQNSKIATYDFYRAHLGRLEALLAEGLDIRYETILDTIALNASGNGLTLGFNGTDSLSLEMNPEMDLVVAADGIHSTLRNYLLPERKPKVLPYVVFHGSRKVPQDVFLRDFNSSFGGGTVLTLRRNGFIISVHLDGLPSTPDSDYRISWTYSRSASQDHSDPLYRPARTNKQAKEIPPEFYVEMAKLASLNLEQPFAAIVDPETLKRDRVLHWLMRSFIVGTARDEYPSGDLGVVFLGDAGHALPIIGSTGAEVAVENALILARIIKERVSEHPEKSITEFYEQLAWARNPERPGELFSKWSTDVFNAEMKLLKMHRDTNYDHNTQKDESTIDRLS